MTARIGLLYGALGVGSLAAGLVFLRVFRPDRVRVLTPGTLLSGRRPRRDPRRQHDGSRAPHHCCGSLAIGTAIVVGITYRQLAAPDDLRSSVNVIGRMIAWGGQPFGAATGAAIAATTDVPTAFIVASAITLISGIGAAIASERDDRQISRRGVTMSRSGRLLPCASS